MDLKKLFRSLKNCQTRIGIERDKLRDLEDEINALRESCEIGLESLDIILEEFQYVVETLSETI